MGLLRFITLKIRHREFLSNWKSANQNINLLLSVRMLAKGLFCRFSLKMVKALLNANLSTIRLNNLQSNQCKGSLPIKKVNMWQK